MEKNRKKKKKRKKHLELGVVLIMTEAIAGSPVSPE